MSAATAFSCLLRHSLFLALSLPSAAFASAAPPIASEHPEDRAAVLASRLYSDGDVARVVYASMNVGGCTGTMIGPSVLFTAAHCGDHDRVVEFPVFHEAFSCKTLLNTFPRSDVVLMYCDGAPGLRYGWLDFDRAPLAAGRRVASAWMNPIDSLGLPWTQVWSEGQVFETTANIWGPNPADSGPINEELGIGTTLWSQPGCSGSSIVDPVTQRIVAGPTSTAVYDGAGRWALPANVTFARAAVLGWNNNGTWTTGVHDATLRALGLDPAMYVGALDEDHDGLFDVQVDLERREGEHTRERYALGLASERRAALWEVSGTTLRHRLLNLPPRRSYVVSVEVDVTHSNGGAMTVSLGAQTQTIALTVGRAVHAVHLLDLAGGADLVLAPSGDVAYSVKDVVLTVVGSVRNFDTADEREGFRRGDHAAPIVPEGNTSWALRVEPGEPAVMAHPGVVEAPYTLCFDVRSDNHGLGEVTMGSLRQSFGAGASWAAVCTGAFVPRGALEFSGGTYFVDNVRFVPEGTELLPPPAPKKSKPWPFNCGGGDLGAFAFVGLVVLVGRGRAARGQ